MTMHVFCEAFRVPKAGNAIAEYEDAFCPEPRVDGENRSEVSIALADGATESSFSAIWAKKLVRAYCKKKFQPQEIQQWLAELQRSWSKIVSRKPLPWYAEEKVRNGTFSTLLGFRICDTDETGKHCHWEALAVGDTCLVQIRGERVLCAFPLTNSSQFNTNPFLIGSNLESNKELLSYLKVSQGVWEAGDAFYLMTDALAAWFFREVESDGTPWRILRDLDTEEQLPFESWIEALRNNKRIRNDDVTLYRIEIN